MKKANDVEVDNEICDEIKLVIWDLDETFWKGTLSEGTVVIPNSHLVLLRLLSERGILNSICSKNEYDLTKLRIQESKVWDEFIYPSINWESKGNRIREIIQNFGFLSKNTLFIDDSRGNLEEAKYYNPGINTLPVVDEDLIRSSPFLQGNPKKGRARLDEYKSLETRFQLKQSFSSNREFLISSEIKIYIDYDVESHLDRCIELNDRSNQLNFSKNRCEAFAASRASLLRSLNKFTATGGVVFCRDNFNDYGIVGYFVFGMMREKDPSESLFKSSDFHFVFSCRIMNMGIEQYIYKNFIKGEGRSNAAYPKLGALRDFDLDLSYISRFDSYEEYMYGSRLNPPIRENLAYVGTCETVHTISFVHHECHELFHCRFLELSDEDFESLFKYDLLVISLWLHNFGDVELIKEKVQELIQKTESTRLKIILIDTADVRFCGHIASANNVFLVSLPFSKSCLVHDSMHYHRSEYEKLSKKIIEAYHKLRALV